MNNEWIIKLHANCIPVRGARRSIICDLHDHIYKFIPNALYEILTECKDRSVGAIKQHYQHEFDREIDEYLQFILDNDLGFPCAESELALYPDLDLHWERPELITNTLLDFDPEDPYDLAAAAREMNAVNCKALQIRLFKPVSLQTIRDILQHFQWGPLQHIDLLTGYHPDISEEDLVRLSEEHRRLNLVTFHSSPSEELKELNQQGMSILYIRNKVLSSDHCGVINPAFFQVNLGLFTESLVANSCLNRKISIDVRGDIRNCPSLPRTYGNIASTGFLEVLQDADFHLAGQIRKDEVLICRHCEFRYICTDCRAFTEDAGHPLSKPAKCGYDPFTAKWEETLLKKEEML